MTGQTNFEEFCQKLQSITLSSEQIESNNLSIVDLYYLKHKNDDQEYGPINKAELLKILPENPETYPVFLVRAYSQSEYFPLVNHPLFQRRKPQIVENEFTKNNPLGISEGEGHLLLEGQKKGPFSFESIQSMLKSKECLYTDLISLDDGQTWGKLFMLPQFDRRTEERISLPGQAKDQTLVLNSEEINRKMESGELAEDAKDQMAHLAFIGQNKPKGKDHQAPKKLSKWQEIWSKHNSMILAGSGAFVLLIFFVLQLGINKNLNFGNISKQAKKTPRVINNKAPSKKQGAKAPASTTAYKLDNSAKNVQKPKKRPKRRKKVSKAESRNKRLQRTRNNNSNARLDDPRDEHFDEYEDFDEYGEPKRKKKKSKKRKLSSDQGNGYDDMEEDFEEDNLDNEGDYEEY